MHKLASEEFAEFLSGTTLVDVTIWSVSVERGDGQGPPRKLEFGERAERVHAEADRATVHATYGVRMLDEKGRLIATLEVTMRAEYRTPATMTDEVFALFRQVTLRLHTTPFAREWFRDMSGRMGFQPIVLPLALAHPAAFPAPKRRAAKKESTK